MRAMAWMVVDDNCVGRLKACAERVLDEALP